MGLLRVTVIERRRLVATEARVYLSLEGESFVLGNAALEKAREVRSFVARIREEGLDGKQIPIEVQGIRVNNAKGLMSKAQKADFLIMARMEPLHLATLFDIIAGQKNVKLRRLEWNFEDFEASISMAAAAMKKARRKANAIAKASEHVVVGVHLASDSWHMPVQHIELGEVTPVTERSYGRESLTKAGIEPEIGVEYNATQEIQVELTVDFVIE